MIVKVKEGGGGKRRERERKIRVWEALGWARGENGDMVIGWPYEEEKRQRGKRRWKKREEKKEEGKKEGEDQITNFINECYQESEFIGNYQQIFTIILMDGLMVICDYWQISMTTLLMDFWPLVIN